MQGIDVNVNYLIYPTSVLCISMLTASASLKIAGTNNFNEGDLPISGVKLQRR
jgi:hypothetical protein